MAKKLSKYGNSFAIIIDKPILELLEISENTSLKLKTDGENIIIEPIRNGRSLPQPLEPLDTLGTSARGEPVESIRARTNTEFRKGSNKKKNKSKKSYDEIVEEFGPALEKLAK